MACFLSLKPAIGYEPYSDEIGLLPMLRLINEPVPIVMTQSPGLKAHSAMSEAWQSPILSNIFLLIVY